MDIDATATQITTLPKSEWLAAVEALPEAEREPVKDAIRLMFKRHSAFRVYIEGKRQPVSMICSERATVAEALESARQVFIKHNVMKVEAMTQ